MKIASIAAALISLALATGCSSTETTKTPAPGPSATAEPTATPAPSDTAPPAAAVKAPTIDTIMPMVGALHVSWTNAEPACDSIELERKTATVAYKVVATLPGEADNKHDASATEATMYTYRLRCKKAAIYSPYSNEMSAKP